MTLKNLLKDINNRTHKLSKLTGVKWIAVIKIKSEYNIPVRRITK